MCLDICVLHVCVYIDIRNEVSIRVSRLDNLTVKACISIVLLLVAGHLEASRGTLQPDPCSTSHDVGKKVQASLSQEEKRYLFVLVLSMPRHSGSSPARLCFAGRLLHFMKYSCTLLLLQLLSSLG